MHILIRNAPTQHSVAFESVRSDDSSTQKRRVSSPAALSVPTSEENTDDGEDMQSGGSTAESDTSLVGRRGSGDADGSTRYLFIYYLLFILFFISFFILFFFSVDLFV